MRRTWTDAHQISAREVSEHGIYVTVVLPIRIVVIEKPGSQLSHRPRTVAHSPQQGGGPTHTVARPTVPSEAGYVPVGNLNNETGAASRANRIRQEKATPYQEFSRESSSSWT
jgi:hypothetical protein